MFLLLALLESFYKIEKKQICPWFKRNVDKEDADLLLTQLRRNVACKNILYVFQALQEHSWRKYRSVPSTAGTLLEKIQICSKHCRNIPGEYTDLFPALQEHSWRIYRSVPSTAGTLLAKYRSVLNTTQQSCCLRKCRFVPSTAETFLEKSVVL